LLVIHDFTMCFLVPHRFWSCVRYWAWRMSWWVRERLSHRLPVVSVWCKQRRSACHGSTKITRCPPRGGKLWTRWPRLEKKVTDCHRLIAPLRLNRDSTTADHRVRPVVSLLLVKSLREGPQEMVGYLAPTIAPRRRSPDLNLDLQTRIPDGGKQRCRLLSKKTSMWTSARRHESRKDLQSTDRPQSSLVST
jgi:hypothetical protein